ncbi:unnamed protein product, partial [Musa acuminata subsp. burmannicoides]
GKPHSDAASTTLRSPPQRSSFSCSFEISFLSYSCNLYTDSATGHCSQSNAEYVPIAPVEHRPVGDVIDGVPAAYEQ